MHMINQRITKVKASERSKTNINIHPASTSNLTIDNYGKNTSTAGGATPESSQDFSGAITCLKPANIPMESQTTYQVGLDGMLLQNEDEFRNDLSNNNQAWKSPEKTQYAEWVTNNVSESQIVDTQKRHISN